MDLLTNKLLDFPFFFLACTRVCDARRTASAPDEAAVRLHTSPAKWGFISAWRVGNVPAGVGIRCPDSLALLRDGRERDFTCKEETEAAGAPWLMFDESATREKQTNPLRETLPPETECDLPYS